MTRYEEGLPVDVLFEPHDVVTPLAKVISDAGLAQFHCAETEKYPHVTFFINGGREEPFPGEDRTMIPSPKVATYDLQPEMSAIPVADATVKAVETVDAQLARVLAALKDAGGVALVIADHGNAEEEIDEATGGPMTAHTTNPVPFVLVGAGQVKLREGAVLSSVAPTILHLLGLPIPLAMTTPSLLASKEPSVG
jgi:2,3-bisphosphoglycerate-independent phosphoglycerate mutase